MESMSNDDSTSSPDLNNEDLFSKEKSRLQSFVSKNPSYLPEIVEPYVIKSAKYSLDFRNKGNELYLQKVHGPSLHDEVLQMYIKCITFAPNNSPELALGYGNRSALLFHVRKYAESIEDCDRAVSVGIAWNLKLRLLCRKIESLFLLNRPLIDTSIDVLKQIHASALDERIKNGYIIKISKILIANARRPNNNANMINYRDELLSFKRSEQIPFASDAIAVNYNSEWGKHIIATKDIEPGDLISVEKYLAQPCEIGSYTLCSYCVSHALNVVPCENCTSALYCSDSCRKNAWAKYHQYECPIIDSLQSMCEDAYYSVTFLTIKIVLSAVEEAGSIEELKKQVLTAMKCNDPQLLKFPKDIFDSITAVISILKMQDPNNSYCSDYYEGMIKICCSIVYLLNKQTTFFGKEEDLSMMQIFEDDNKLFITSLLLKVFRLTFKFGDDIFFYPRYGKNNDDELAFGLTILKNYFNHSCYANVKIVQANTLCVLFARCPIKKGEQLFLDEEYEFFMPKSERQEELMDRYNIKCNCIACKEDWSHICIPTLEQLVKITPALQETCKKLKVLSGPPPDNLAEIYKTLKNISYNMKIVSTEITTLCDVYHHYESFMESLLEKMFSSMIEIPNDCSGEEELTKAISIVQVT